MTNGERFKTAEERKKAYAEYYQLCLKNILQFVSSFEWLELECKETLKRCPFCGGAAELNREHFVRCSECRAETMICDTDDEAISAWNRRA